MSQSLRSMSTAAQKAAIARRIGGKTGGLGYLAARDAQVRIAEKNRAEAMAANSDQGDQEQGDSQ